MKAIMLVLVALFSFNCGSIAIDADEALDKISELFNSEDSTDEIRDEDEQESAKKDKTAEEDDSLILATGVEVASDARTFMGTYNINLYNSWCTSSLDVPYTVRAYSHNFEDAIDFEDSSGALVWVADTFPDESFDFIIQYVNSFNQPKLGMYCTCIIQKGYGGYYGDEIQCTCSGNGESCELDWTQI